MIRAIMKEEIAESQEHILTEVNKNRDTMQALEQSLRILAEVQECPDYAVEFRVKEECT